MVLVQSKLKDKNKEREREKKVESRQIIKVKEQIE